MGFNYLKKQISNTSFHRCNLNIRYNIPRNDIVFFWQQVRMFSLVFDQVSHTSGEFKKNEKITSHVKDQIFFAE